MSIQVAVQYAAPRGGAPAAKDFRLWARAALQGRRKRVQMAIRIVDKPESARLNQSFRGKTGAANVLSFPMEAPRQAPVALLGDLVICAPVVEREANAQGKQPQAHWAHMVVHGVLHLLGYRHDNNPEAAAMESLEIEILGHLGFSDPYAQPEER